MGMLFDCLLAGSSQVSMWLKNTYISLDYDVIHCAHDGRGILGSLKNPLEPLSTRRLHSVGLGLAKGYFRSFEG